MARGKSYAKPGNRFVTGERMKVLNENVTYNTTPLLPSSFLVHLSISPGKRVNSYFPRRVDLRSSILSDTTFSIHARFTMYLFVYKKREKKKEGRNEKLFEYYPPPRICRYTLLGYLYARRRSNIRSIHSLSLFDETKDAREGSCTTERDRDREKRKEGNNTSGMNSNRQRSACFLKHE